MYACSCLVCYLYMFCVVILYICIIYYICILHQLIGNHRLFSGQTLVQVGSQLGPQSAFSCIFKVHFQIELKNGSIWRIILLKKDDQR